MVKGLLPLFGNSFNLMFNDFMCGFSTIYF